MNKSVQIHQLTSGISFGDAISNHIVDTKKALNDAGYESEIFCEAIPSLDFGHRIYSLDKYEQEVSSSNNILLVHFALYFSEQLVAWLKHLPDQKILVYHNITPHTYFYGVNEALYDAAKRGRKQLQILSSFIDTAIGDSSYNCNELRDSGWQAVYRLPISFDTERYETKPSSKIIKWGEKRANILFVGRVAPNKKFEDLLLTFYYVKNIVLPEARLVLVGSGQGMEPYANYLQAIIKQLQLKDVHITGHVSMAELVAYYRTASVYLSMSEHEGFGVPLLESIYFDVPVLAYKSSAVSETLGGQGILFTEKRYQDIAELIGLIINDTKLKQKIVQNQRQTLSHFSYTTFQQKLLKIIEEILNRSKTATTQ